MDSDLPSTARLEMADASLPSPFRDHQLQSGSTTDSDFPELAGLEDEILETPRGWIKGPRPGTYGPNFRFSVPPDNTAVAQPGSLHQFGGAINNDIGPIIQPRIEPSPLLRKSFIAKDIENKMYPLGLAKAFNPKKKESYVKSWKKKDRVYKGNPFAEILRNRKRIEIFDNKYDLSDLEDLPTQAVKKIDSFVVEGRYVETLVLLLSKEDPSKPLDAPGQPAFFKVPLLEVRKSGCLFARLLEEKDKKISRFNGDTIVYSFDKSHANLHIQEYAIYIDALMKSDTARASGGYSLVENLTTGDLWIGLLVWRDWRASKGFRASYTEQQLWNALRVGTFVRDEEYSIALYDMVNSSGHEVFSNISCARR